MLPIVHPSPDYKALNCAAQSQLATLSARFILFAGQNNFKTLGSYESYKGGFYILSEPNIQTLLES